MNALNHLDRQLMGILLEPVRGEFGLSDIQLGLLSGPAFAVVYTVLGFPAAIWATRRSKIGLISAAAMIWGAATAASGLAQSFAQLLFGRFFVGVGEAGVTPAAQALISHLYETSRRTTAMSVFTAGLNAGVFFAFLIGGFVGRAYGWRAAFIAAGTATVLFGLVLRLTGHDGAGRSDRSTSTRPAAVMGDTLRHIWTDPALRHICLGATLTSTVGYGALAWMPSFLVRAHQLDIAKAGLFLAVVIGLGGAAGTWIAGVLSDRLRVRDIRWSLWLVALVFLATKPLSIGSYLTDDTPLALALFVLPGMAGSVFLGPSVAVLHDRVTPMLRPVASAALMFLVNLVGLGLGPLLVGGMSEYVFGRGGAHSLGYALVVMQILGVWGVVHYIVAGQKLALTRTRRPAEALR